MIEGRIPRPPRRSAPVLPALLLLAIPAAGLWLTADWLPRSLRAAAPDATFSVQTAPTLTLGTDPLHMITDGPFEVSIAVNGATDFGALEMELVYEDDLVDVSSVAVGPYLGEPEPSCTPETERCAVDLGPLDQAGTTAVGAYSYGTGDGGSGSGTVLTLTVNPTGASGQVSMIPTDTLAVDTVSGVIDVLSEGVTFDVGTSGNCNDDSAVDAGDISALILEIFDGDGSTALGARGSSFFGNPIGCDANEDGTVDAGDLSCAILLIFGGPGACG